MAQSFDHAMDLLYGWFHPHALQFVAKMATSVVKSPVYQGSCVSLNSSGAFIPGCSGAGDMPMFLWTGSTDFDAKNDGNNDWWAMNPSGDLTALVATGGYEIATTEFDTGTGSYAPGALLMSPTEAVVGSGYETQAGKLYRLKTYQGGGNGAVAGTDKVVGTVSRGRYVNHNNKAVLAFWPVFHIPNPVVP